jgi:hypothetical protein
MAGLLLDLISRVVFGSTLFDRPRTIAWNCANGFTLAPNKMLHAGLPISVGASRHGCGFVGVELCSHADVERPCDDGHALHLAPREGLPGTPIVGADCAFHVYALAAPNYP